MEPSRPCEALQLSFEGLQMPGRLSHRLPLAKEKSLAEGVQWCFAGVRCSGSSCEFFWSRTGACLPFLR